MSCSMTRAMLAPASLARSKASTRISCSDSMAAALTVRESSKARPISRFGLLTSSFNMSPRCGSKCWRGQNGLSTGSPLSLEFDTKSLRNHLVWATCPGAGRMVVRCASQRGRASIRAHRRVPKRERRQVSADAVTVCWATPSGSTSRACAAPPAPGHGHGRCPEVRVGAGLRRRAAPCRSLLVWFLSGNRSLDLMRYRMDFVDFCYSRAKTRFRPEITVIFGVADMISA